MWTHAHIDKWLIRAGRGHSTRGSSLWPRDLGGGIALWLTSELPPEPLSRPVLGLNAAVLGLNVPVLCVNAPVLGLDVPFLCVNAPFTSSGAPIQHVCHQACRQTDEGGSVTLTGRIGSIDLWHASVIHWSQSCILIIMIIIIMHPPHTKAPIDVYGVEGRYATALFSAASKKKQLDQVEQELGKLSVSC